jgi:adenylate cyclase
MSSPPIIVVRSPDRVALHLFIDEPLEIGRDCAGLLLDDPLISRRHLEVRADGGQVTVRDLGSTNGSTIRGAPLTSPTVLAVGDVVVFGASTLVLAPAAQARGPQGSRQEDQPSQTVDFKKTSIDIVADAYSADQGVADELPIQHGTTTIVFSDIESSTARAEKLGDQRWFELLSAHNDLVRRQVAVHQGKEIKSQGDGFMLSFPSARGAVQCMMAVQRDLAQHNELNPDRQIRIRIGIHTGEAIVDGDGDLFGKHVILAARIANEASGGEIVVSSLVRQIIEAHGDINFGDERITELKGLAGTYTIFPIVWTDGVEREN